MATIDRLSETNSLEMGDLLPLDQSGVVNKMSLSALLAWMQENFNTAVLRPRRLHTRQEVYVTDDPFTVEMSNIQDDIWLFLEIEDWGPFGQGTIKFPSNPVEQQEVIIKFVGDIDEIIWDGNGAEVITVADAVTAWQATSCLVFRYDEEKNTWTATS
jgi:hypothetical protein